MVWPLSGEPAESDLMDVFLLTAPNFQVESATMLSASRLSCQLRSGLVLLSLSLSGCLGGSSLPPIPETVPVSGVVLLDGKPLVAASILFVPSQGTKGIECSGVTDDDGRFELKHPHGPTGAPAGTYGVVVSRLVDSRGLAILPNPDVPPADLGAVESLPPRYSSFDQTTLKAEIPHSAGELKFELKSR